MLPFLASVVLLYASCVVEVQCQGLDDTEGYFITPPANGAGLDFKDNRVYSLHSVQKLEWTSYLSNYSLLLWQQNFTSVGATHSANPLFSTT